MATKCPISPNGIVAYLHRQQDGTITDPGCYIRILVPEGPLPDGNRHRKMSVGLVILVLSKTGRRRVLEIT